MRGHVAGLVIGTTLAFGTAVLVAGCGDDGATGSGAPATTDPAPVTTDGPGGTTTSAPAETPLLVLEVDGLGVATESSASITRLPFGSERDQVRDAVRRALGEPRDETPQPECPPGPAEQTRHGELALTFMDGRFVGWSAPYGSTLTTANGIGPGASLADLRSEFGDVEFVESTLGVEVLAGGYDVLLDGEDDDAKIDAMLAGVNCVYR